MSINESIRRLFRSLFSPSISTGDRIRSINHCRVELASASDEELKNLNSRSIDLLETIAITAVVAARVLGLVMFDVQLQGALALAQGKIAEMQTGEGKTLAAVPAVIWFAKQGRGVHVMTANDYLARRDAEWMGGIYKFLGFSVGCIQQRLNSSERKGAYASDHLRHGERVRLRLSSRSVCFEAAGSGPSAIRSRAG
jgi:preprotein translocase subunit SecA